MEVGNRASGAVRRGAVSRPANGTDVYARCSIFARQRCGSRASGALAALRRSPVPSTAGHDFRSFHRTEILSDEASKTVDRLVEAGAVLI
jgi:hypothetical protein